MLLVGSLLDVGFCSSYSADVGFNYGMICKAVERLSEGIKDGNGDEFAKDVSRLANFTSRSAISVEMRETVKCLFRETRKEYVCPSPSLVSLLKNWDLISLFIREGGKGKVYIDDLPYDMDAFRRMITMINVDGKVLSGDGAAVVKRESNDANKGHEKKK